MGRRPYPRASMSLRPIPLPGQRPRGTPAFPPGATLKGAAHAATARAGGVLRLTGGDGEALSAPTAAAVTSASTPTAAPEAAAPRSAHRAGRRPGAHRRLPSGWRLAARPAGPRAAGGGALAAEPAGQFRS